jgi:surface antigen Omp85-like protein
MIWGDALITPRLLWWRRSRIRVSRGCLRGAVRVHCMRDLAAAAMVFALTVVSASAAADDRLNLPEETTEVGAVPLAGGDSDIGFGGGELSSITRVMPGLTPYLWRIESGALLTVKPPAGHGWRVPYQDYYVQLVIPAFLQSSIRLEIRPSYTKETTQLYYGIGNASPAPLLGPEGQLEADYFQYGRTHPTLVARLRLLLGDGFFFLVGDSITYNRIDVHADSRLARDIVSPDAEQRRFFGPLTPHFVNFFEYALLYDTRDNETSPQRGMFHQVKLRLSPGGTSAFPYRYAQVDAVARFYATLIRRRLGVDLRIVGDAQFGDPPFYELARYEDTFALGGSNGVRGVPAQRYYGKIKLFGNLETRSHVTSFNLLGGEYMLGLAAFLDAGRVWADWRKNTALDGSGVGLKYGVGGGLRIQKGEAFVVRADLAWSPDARPIGAYFTAGQIF